MIWPFSKLERRIEKLWEVMEEKDAEIAVNRRAILGLKKRIEDLEEQMKKLEEGRS